MASTQTPSKATLSASKVAELKALCSQNGLPVSGNKGELILRLSHYFESVQTSSTPQATPRKDLILSSNPAPPKSAVAPPSSKLAATTQPAAPTTIPKSVKPTQNPTPPTNTAQNTQGPEVSSTPVSSDEKTIDSELEKRKQRAQRFGLPDPSSKTTANPPASEDDAKKSMRAKRFGLTAEVNAALDQPLADGKEAAKVVIKSAADLEWEVRKRKRAEKFGLVDNPPSSALNDGTHRKHQRPSNHRSRQ